MRKRKKKKRRNKMTRKMTLTRWAVMFLVGCVFALELAMVAQEVLGDKAIPQVIGFFIPPGF
jgi:uncharacterized protein YcsI (UPF0317 family)